MTSLIPAECQEFSTGYVNALAQQTSGYQCVDFEAQNGSHMTENKSNQS